MIPPQKHTGFCECVMLSVKQMRSTSLSNFFHCTFVSPPSVRHSATAEESVTPPTASESRYNVPNDLKPVPLHSSVPDSQCDVCQPGGHTLTTTCVHGQPPMCKHDCLQSAHKRRESRPLQPAQYPRSHHIFLFVFSFSLSDSRKKYIPVFFFFFLPVGL